MVCGHGATQKGFWFFSYIYIGLVLFEPKNRYYYAGHILYLRSTINSKFGLGMVIYGMFINL